MFNDHKVGMNPLATNPALFQPDRIHPNEAAQPLMFERVWKALQPLLKTEKQG